MEQFYWAATLREWLTKLENDARETGDLSLIATMHITTEAVRDKIAELERDRARMTKARLKRYRAVVAEKEELMQKLEAIESNLYSPKVPTNSGMPSSGGSAGNAKEDLAIKHLELVDFYRQKVTEAEAEQLAVEQAIQDLPPQLRRLMRHKYIDGKTWDQVCVAINYSWSETHRMHSAALRHLQSSGNKKEDEHEEVSTV